jgi:putative endonuclease
VRDPQANERARRGAAAEAIAAAYLRLRGCEIIGRNVRIGGGEIDLIARKGIWLLLVEVRFRSNHAFGHPIETVVGRKARALARAGRAYLASCQRDATCWRFDVVTVSLLPQGGCRIECFEGAVPLGGG